MAGKQHFPADLSPEQVIALQDALLEPLPHGVKAKLVKAAESGQAGAAKVAGSTSRSSVGR